MGHDGFLIASLNIDAGRLGYVIGMESASMYCEQLKQCYQFRSLGAKMTKQQISKVIETCISSPNFGLF